MMPMDGSKTWFESGPEPILNDPALATLIVRVGMASNALITQFNHARGRLGRGAARTRNVLHMLVTSAAITNEAIDLARSEMKTLRHLEETGVHDPLLASIAAHLIEPEA